jgi:hypothetical protein
MSASGRQLLGVSSQTPSRRIMAWTPFNFSALGRSGTFRRGRASASRGARSSFTCHRPELDAWKMAAVLSTCTGSGQEVTLMTTRLMRFFELERGLLEFVS